MRIKRLWLVTACAALAICATSSAASASEISEAVRHMQSIEIKFNPKTGEITSTTIERSRDGTGLQAHVTEDSVDKIRNKLKAYFKKHGAAIADKVDEHVEKHIKIK